MDAGGRTVDSKMTPAWMRLRVPLCYLVLAYVFHAIDVNILSIALAPGDGAVHGVPSKIYGAEWSLWNPFVLSGVSRLASQGFQTLYWPGILVMKAFPSELGYNINLLLHYALAGYFTFLFMGSLGRSPVAAFVSGICFMFSGFMSAHKGHHMMVNAAVWLPLVLYFIERFFAAPKRLQWLFLGSAAYAMTFYADYLAVPMYTAMVVAPYVVFRMVKTGHGLLFRRVTRGVTTAMAVLGLGMVFAAPYILPIVESVSRVTREHISYETFASYSFPILALPMLLFPFAFGTQSPGFYRATYFGPWNLTEVAGYVGLTPLVVATVAFLVMRKRDSQVWFWAIVAMAGFVLVLGYQTPLHRVLYHVPVYNMFRAPARNWLEVHFAIAILVGFGLDLIREHPAESGPLPRLFTRCWVTAAAAAAAMAIVFGAVRTLLTQRKVGAVVPWASDFAIAASDLPMHIGRSWSVSAPNMYVPFLVILLGASATWVALRFMRNSNHRVLVIGAAVFVDLFSFGHFHDSNYDLSTVAGAAATGDVSEWLRHNEPARGGYRVLPFESMEPDELFPNVNLRQHVAAVNGYGAILLKEYADLLALNANGAVGRPGFLIDNGAILSSLSVRYLITRDQRLKSLIERAACAKWPQAHGLCDPFQLSARDGSEVPTYQKVLEGRGRVALYRNNKALPLIRFAGGIRCVDDFREARAILENGTSFDPRRTTIVECGNEVPESAAMGGGLLQIELRGPDRWLVTADTEAQALLVVGQSHYPGWEAHVDGHRTSLLKADGVLQGIWIPSAGRHRIELVFNPFSFRFGLWLMASALLGVSLVLLVARHQGRHFGGRSSQSN